LIRSLSTKDENCPQEKDEIAPAVVSSMVGSFLTSLKEEPTAKRKKVEGQDAC
jgi:hypothetical protein